MKDRLTVLFPIDDLGVGGAEQQLLELVRGLDKARFQPIVVTLKPGEPLEREFKEVPGVELLSLGRQGKYDFFCLFKMFRILLSRKVDIVQPFLTPATFFGLLPALALRTPVKIVTKRSGIETEGASAGLRLYLKAEGFLSRFAEWAIPNSSAGKEYLLSLGFPRSRIKVIPNGINRDRLTGSYGSAEEARRKLHLPGDGKLVGIVSSLLPIKGHSILLQAAGQVLRATPDTKFVIVGDGPLRGSLEDQARELGLSSAVVFCGVQREVGAYLSALDVAVLPSYREGCSNFILEAMALGKPVVATDIVGNRDIVQDKDTGLLVPPGNINALAQAIIAVLQDEETARAMGRRGRERVISDFSLEGMIAQYQSLYEETWRQKAGRRERQAGKRAGVGLLLLCATTRVSPEARERVSQLLRLPLDWDYLLDCARFQGVTPLLFHSLTTAGLVDMVPRPYLDRMKGDYFATLGRNTMFSAEVQRVLTAFSQRDIPAVVLKGVVLAERLYGDLGLRPVGDIDILVPAEHLPPATACLAEEGYRALLPHGSGHDRHPFHDTYLKQGAVSPFRLDLHGALEDSGLTAFPHQEIWRRTQPLMYHGVAGLELSLEDTLLLLCHHLTKHDSLLLKLLCDVAELVKRHQDDLDWDYVQDSACLWGIRSGVYYSLKTAQDLLMAPVPGRVLGAMRPEAWRRWLIDLLTGHDMFVTVPRNARLRSGTLLLARSLMMGRPHQMLAVLSRLRGVDSKWAWLRTAAWIAAVFVASLGRCGARIFRAQGITGR